MTRSKAAAKRVEAVDQVVATREQLREVARRQLGVTGEETAEPFRAVARRYQLAYYPLFAICLLEVVDRLQDYGFSVLAPDISRTLGISLGAIAFASGLNYIAVTSSPLVVARLVQFGRRRAWLCLVTAFAWSLVTLTTGFVTSLAALVLILVIDGLTTGSVAALHTPLIMDTYPPEARVRALSTYTSATFLGNVAGPLLVALLAGPLGLTWRGVFVGIGLISTGLSFLALRLRDPGYGRWDSQAVRNTVRHEDGADVTRVTAEEVKLGFWEICRRILMIPTARRVYLGIGVFGLLQIPLNTFLSFFLDQRWNLGASARGLFFAYYAAASIGGLLLFGKRGEKQFRRTPALVLRTAGSLLGLAVVFIAIGGLSPDYSLMLAMFGISGALIGPLLPAFYVALLSIVPSEMRPHAQALSGIFSAVGALVGAIFFSGIDHRYGIDGSIVAVAFPGLIGAAVIASAGRHVDSDLDRMIDDLVEEEQINQIRDSGGRLPMLVCQHIDFSYGTLQVLFDLDFTVDDGEMVALLGVNGAGKSTLLRVISGVGLPSGGSVRFGGQDITFLDAERRTKLGITQVPGGRAVFGPLTVVDNLRTYGYTLGKNRRALDRAIEECFEAFPRLYERRTSLASTLSGGEQQMLGLCKALILKPRLLVIDELSLGLAPIVVGQLLEMVRRINSEGSAVVLVEQSVNIALNLVEHAYFMEKGEMRFDGRASDLLARDDLLRAVFLSGTGGSR